MRPMTFNRKRIHSFHILLAACLLIVSVGAANLSVVADAFGAMQLQITISNPFENNWRTIPVHLLTPDQPGFDPAEGSMFWLDENNAWISIRFRSSSSVSTGTSFRTGAGGDSRREIP